MEKLDLKKELRAFYHASAKEPAVVDVPPMRYLMVDGQGDPNHAASYVEAVQSLFTASYAVKFACKKGPRRLDYGVMPLEGLWWTDDMSRFTTEDKSDWKWTLMIHQPAFLSKQEIQVGLDIAAGKELPAAPRLRLQEFEEGRACQILHVGPFTEEGPTVEKLHAFLEGHGKLAGKHHEIYLSDIRRAAPAKWRTVIRQPMA